MIDLLLGLQWGDEGKGKIVDVLTRNYDIIARFQGGPNAGHTLIFDGNKHVLHTIPSGIFHPRAMNLVGNGVVIDPVIFRKELDNLVKHDIKYTDRLLISRKAHLILPTHRLLDAASEKIKDFTVEFTRRSLEAGKGLAEIYFHGDDFSTQKGLGSATLNLATGRKNIKVLPKST